MAVPTVAAIMAGIEVRLGTIDGLRVSDVAPDQINPPAAIVGVPPLNYTGFNRGRIQIEPTVTVLVSAALSRVGQHALAAYANPAGASSVKAAIEADRTLGGVVADCVVVSFRPLGLEEVALIGYFGGVFELRAIA